MQVININLYWYEAAKEKCSPTLDRNLHALINFQWPRDLYQAVTQAEIME